MPPGVSVPGEPASSGAGALTGLRLRFGDWLFDAESRELRGPGGAVHLSPKAYALLSALLESRPRALSKEELHDRLWASTFVSESCLAGLVTEIRRALGDSPHRPAFLRTVHGFGYAFCGEAADPSRRRAPGGRGIGCFLCLESRELLLDEGETVLGRAADASHRIESATVSRRHARIVLAAGIATIEDLGSKHGTYLRGRRLNGAASLADGDEIRLGSVRALFRVVSESDATLTHAGPVA
jgi:DNA-binding winged helix-turn-helix (wHTH) protein